MTPRIVPDPHPYNRDYKIPCETRTLIVGTAPPPRFTRTDVTAGSDELDFSFYYGSAHNYMWQFLEQYVSHRYQRKLFADDDSDDQCCRSASLFLRDSGLWMHDVLNSIRRKPGRETSASDGDLVEPEPHDLVDFRALLEKHDAITKICFTSELAANWTFRALSERDLFKQSWAQWASYKKKLEPEARYQKCFAELQVADRKVEFYVLPTPTGRGLKVITKQRIYWSVLFGYSPIPAESA